METLQGAGIRDFVSEAISHLPDGNLATAVDSAFRQEQASVDRIESCFAELTSRTWSKSALERFFHGWRDTHLTATSVAAMACRLLSLAEAAADKDATWFEASASETAKIIHEDLGLLGYPHAELYDRLATSVCGADEWGLCRNRVSSAFEFRKWVHHQRVVARDVQEGLLTTIASEIYNHGQYSAIAPLFQHWLEETLQLEEKQVQSAMAYIMVHTGDTESGHFMYGMKALSHYCRGAQVPVDYSRIEGRCAEYLSRAAKAFDGIAEQLQ